LASNPELISTLSRFGIRLGFGEKSVEQVCRESGVDTKTFLAVMNLLDRRMASATDISVRSLLGYLRNSHSYFLEFVLPRLRRDLIEAISGDSQGELTMMIMKFYDDFMDEVTRHMREEETDVFIPIDALLEGRQVPDFSIESFSASHRPMDARLVELKEIFVCHYHVESPANADLLNSVLHDIIQCGRDISMHGNIEEQLLVPAVRRIESEFATPQVEELPRGDRDAQELTAREKEIVAAIAHGLGNKQIADKLCVSVHTVTTHRRNICAKLDIHSPAGLTIYALIHGIINIEDLAESV